MRKSNMLPDRPISASLHAYLTLRDRIISLDLKPGSPVGEQALADLLGVSRSPVREALSRLSSEGLIDSYSRGGTVVSPIRLDAVASAQFVRETLEVEIIREAALLGGPSHLFSVQQAIAEQEFAVGQTDTGGFFAADERMHGVFSTIARRSLVWPIIADAKRHMDRLRRLSIQMADLGELVADHRLILGAIEARDPDAAERAMRQHLRRAMRQLPDLVSRFGEFIEGTDTVDAILELLDSQGGRHGQA